MSIGDAQRINQTSGNQEYYTPVEIVDAARYVMGGIDLDPASSHAANSKIRARNIYTRDMDGLSREWYGNVWMNHPFGKVENPLWIEKMIEEYESGRVSQACMITFACTSERWFRPLMDYPQCFLVPRTNYLSPDGSVKKGVTKGSVVTYLGPHVDRFARGFSGLGVIKIGYWNYGTLFNYDMGRATWESLPLPE